MATELTLTEQDLELIEATKALQAHPNARISGRNALDLIAKLHIMLENLIATSEKEYREQHIYYTQEIIPSWQRKVKELEEKLENCGSWIY